MKTRLLSTALLITALCFFTSVSAQTIVNYWNFNDNAPPTNTNWDQPIPAQIGNGQITYTFTEAFSFAGTTINGIEGEVNGGSFSPRGGVDNINNGAWFTMSVPTSGYQDIILTYPTRRTSTGFTTQEIQYTINGSTWLTKETIDISGYENNWLATQLVTVNFSGVPDVDDNPDFAIRIVLTGCSSSAGNNRFDNIQITGSQPGAVSPPSNLTAQAVSTSQINLGWILNSNSNPVLVAWSANGTFGNPSGSYNPGDPITGGGTVLYAGSNASFNHTSLQSNTTYYYKVWSYAGSDYSTGITANATTQADPAFTTLPYVETFDENLGQCYTYSVAGPTRFWQHGTTSGNGFAVMNGFGSAGLEEDWLILPGINMNNYGSVVLSFETAWNFGIEDDNNYLKLYYSTNYSGTGSPAGASWTELPFTKPAEGNYTWQSSGNIDLSSISGTVWLGFKYHYAVEYRRWQVDNINIVESNAPAIAADPGTLAGFTYETGQGPSAQQSFSVSGVNLTGNITIVPPVSYEISLSSGSGFTSTNPIVLTQTGGSVSPTPVYVRLKAGLAIGAYNEVLQLSSPQANNATVSLSGSVTPQVDPPLLINSPLYVYQQDFNGLASANAGNTWTDNQTVHGWYWQSPSDRDPNDIGYNAQDGSANTVNATSFGLTGSIDRAMGAISGASNRNFFIGVQFRNNTGNPIDLSGIYITFTGEQWRQTANAQALAFSYAISSSIITDIKTGTSWVENSSLDFTAPNTGEAIALNGNDPANRVEFVNVPLGASGTLAPGQYLMLRWAKTGTTSPGLAIDDFMFSLIEMTTIGNPVNFAATSVSTSQIDLNWQLNSASNPVLLAWSANGVFGSVPDTQVPGQDITGGGTVLYFGSGTEFSHEDLNPSTLYYYKAWSFAGGEYSSGVMNQAVTMQDAATTTIPYTENFNQNLGDCFVYSVSGPSKIWNHSIFEDNGYAQMNGFNSGDIEEDWLILPGINFDNYENEILTFGTWWRYGDDDDDNYLKLMYSSDYPGNGDPSGFTWSELTFARPVEEQTWTGSGNIDLSAIVGELVYLGFKYRYEPGNYKWWQVDNISITGDTVGSRVLNIADRLLVWPNPVNDILYLELKADNLRLIVLNLQGQLMVEKVLNQGSSSVNLSELPAGVYFIETVSADNQQVYRNKIIKH
jgi:hypothetical protein